MGIYVDTRKSTVFPVMQNNTFIIIAKLLKLPYYYNIMYLFIQIIIYNFSLYTFPGTCSTIPFNSSITITEFTTFIFKPVLFAIISI